MRYLYSYDVSSPLGRSPNLRKNPRVIQPCLTARNMALQAAARRPRLEVRCHRAGLGSSGDDKGSDWVGHNISGGYKRSSGGDERSSGGNQRSGWHVQGSRWVFRAAGGCAGQFLQLMPMLPGLELLVTILPGCALPVKAREEEELQQQVTVLVDGLGGGGSLDTSTALVSVQQQQQKLQQQQVQLQQRHVQPLQQWARRQ